MESIRSIALILESAISAQLLLFAAFLLSSPRRTAPLFLLAGISLALAAMIAGNLLIGRTGWLWLGDLVLFLDMLLPALAYLYVQQIGQGAAPLSAADAIHVLPAITGFVLWRFGALRSMDVYVIGCWTAYLAASVVFFARHQAGYAPRTLWNFIVVLLGLLGAITVLRVVIAAQAVDGRAFQDGTPYLLVLAGAFLATWQIIFTSLRHPGLLSVPASHVKYAQSNIDAADLGPLAERLDGVLRERKPYLNPDLALADLSALLRAPPRHVSQLINSRYGMNFSALVNQCRIHDAAQQLSASPDAPIKAVMFACGFRSKSIFNREFQRCLGLSPSEFRDAAGKGQVKIAFPAPIAQ